MDRRSFTAMLAATSGTAMVPSPGWARLQLSARQGFITRAANGDLKEGNKTFRYIGADMPEVTHIRTDWDLEQGRRFRLPTKDELDWIVEAAAQGNFKVVRTWCFPSYFQPELPDDIHYLRTNSDGVTVTINKTGFRLFDYFLARCGELGVRAQVPFVYLIGRVRQWDDADGDPHPQMLDFVRQVILRRNTVNGIQYRDDPAIFAWESGNESKPTARWITALAAYVKRMDPNHFVRRRSLGRERRLRQLQRSPACREPRHRHRLLPHLREIAQGMVHDRGHPERPTPFARSEPRPRHWGDLPQHDRVGA